VWAAYDTDKRVLDRVMIDTLEAEQRLCNHIDRLPVPYEMDAEEKMVVSDDRMIFEASEYAKDGLVPSGEITGRQSPWFDRMRGLVDDIFKLARIDSPTRKIPSKQRQLDASALRLIRISRRALAPGS